MKVGRGKCEKRWFATESVSDAVQQSTCPACCSLLLQADENQSLSQQVQFCSSLHQSTTIKYYSLQSKQEQA